MERLLKWYNVAVKHLSFYSPATVTVPLQKLEIWCLRLVCVCVFWQVLSYLPALGSLAQGSSGSHQMNGPTSHSCTGEGSGCRSVIYSCHPVTLLVSTVGFQKSTEAKHAWAYMQALNMCKIIVGLYHNLNQNDWIFDLVTCPVTLCVHKFHLQNIVRKHVSGKILIKLHSFLVFNLSFFGLGACRITELFNQDFCSACFVWFPPT